MTAHEAFKKNRIRFESLVKYKDENGHWVYGKLLDGYQFDHVPETFNVTGITVKADDMVFPEYEDEFYILYPEELVPLQTYEFQESYSTDWVTKVFIGCSPWPNGNIKYVAVDDTISHRVSPQYYNAARLPLEQRIKNRIKEIAPGKEDEVLELINRFKGEPNK